MKKGIGIILRLIFVGFFILPFLAIAYENPTYEEMDSCISCVEVACKYQAYNCNYSWDLNSVVNLCKGVDGSCLEAACKYQAYNCNYSWDLNSVVNLCKNQ